MVMTGPDRLPCGADVDDLINQVADGDAAHRTPHQDGCPHCQAALAEYQRLWAPVQDLTEQHVAVPDGILDHVIRAIRTAGEQAGYGLLRTPLGLTRIADRVVAVTARISAERVAGVRAALAHEHPPSREQPEAVAGVQGGSAAIRITLAVTYGHDLVALADRIRATVAARIRTVTGLEPVEITIIIDDVLEPLG
jgi:uncharacterized alkaline shock family protein YloU